MAPTKEGFRWRVYPQPTLVGHECLW